MKKQKSSQKKLTRKSNRLVVLVIAIAVVAAIGLSFVILGRREIKDEVVQYIESKTSAKQIAEGLEPVIIFQYNTEESKNVEASGGTFHAHFVGSGTMFKHLNGEYFLLTSEHLFTTQMECNYKYSKYLVQVLREKGCPITRGLLNANPFFLGKTSLVDIATCMVSHTRRSPKIIPFSSYYGASVKGEYKVDFSLVTGKPEDLILRSLVSGEEVKILGRENIPGIDNMWRYLVDYQGLAGESGTGFVDRHGQLYILKGSVNTNSLEGFNKVLRGQGLINKDRKGYSIMIGSLDIIKSLADSKK